ncbi:MAG: hypothetical protein JWM16_2692 [Verrucomicrobiales bacterium]|nr:hypothetical protein [Verrucomicrobiales bacterium]
MTTSLKTRLVLFLLLLTATAASAAERPPVPEEPIAKRKELLFSDDFESPEPAKVWHKVVPTFTFEKGTLKGTQTRDQNIPAADGKQAVTPHAAVHGLEIPTRDSVVEVKIRFEGASMIDVEFDDRKYTGAHYGHLCRAQVRTNGVTIIDERDGSMRNDIYEMSKDPSKKAERSKLLTGRQVTYPAKLETGKWYTLVVETVGDSMRVSIDGKPAAFLKSSGIGHATKSKIELGVGGKDGFFDDIKVWNAEPASL